MILANLKPGKCFLVEHALLTVRTGIVIEHGVYATYVAWSNGRRQWVKGD